MTNIILNDLSICFDKVPVINHFSHTFTCGKQYVIIGPSGCGKSTLFKSLAGLLPKEAHMKGSLNNPFKQKTDIVFQDYGLLPWKTAYENMLLPYLIKGKPQPNRSVIMDIVHWFHIENILDKYPRSLSGGEKQRVALARVMLGEAELLLLDEPFSAVDAITRETIQYELKSLLLKEGKTMLLVTHSIEEAVYMGEEIILMNKEGSIKNIFKNNAYNALDSRSDEIYYKMCQTLRNKLSEVLHS